MKKEKAFSMIMALSMGLLSVSCDPRPAEYRMISVEAPFPMEPIREYIFPDRDYPITDFGAVADTANLNTEAINQAVQACSKAGGGRVVIPAGEWVTGPVHLADNVNLHLKKDAVVRFTDDPEAYLPAVMTTWEGMECYNYSPLVYAYNCENIAITGEGTLAPKMDTWRKWFKRPAAHMNALKELYTMASTDVPVQQRQMAVAENNLRPHLIQFNRCKNVLLDGFHIRQSPFWTIHFYLCDGGIARNLDVYAHGHNNDGIDLEMSRNILIEKCKFDQGDDGVVIKSGRNQDAWRLNTPTENVVIRDCRIVNAHTLLGIGSEMSGGVRHIYMHHCEAQDSVFRLFFAKTNHRRGGFIENIWMKNVRAGRMQRVMEVDTDVLYQWRDLVPTYKDSITTIRGLYMDSIWVHRAEVILDLKGDERLPVSHVSVKNVYVKELTDRVKYVKNAENITLEGMW